MTWIQTWFATWFLTWFSTWFGSCDVAILALVFFVMAFAAAWASAPTLSPMALIAVFANSRVIAVHLENLQLTISHVNADLVDLGGVAMELHFHAGDGAEKLVGADVEGGWHLGTRHITSPVGNFV
jgi:hypothetical protein